MTSILSNYKRYIDAIKDSLGKTLSENEREGLRLALALINDFVAGNKIASLYLYQPISPIGQVGR